MTIDGGPLARPFIIVQEEQPTSPFNGQIWLDESSGDTFQFSDGNWKSLGISDDEINQIKEDARKTAQKLAIIL